MTAAERVMAAFTGEESDRPPFTLTLSLYGARLTGVPLLRHYTDPALYAQGQARVADLVDPDIIFAPIALAREAEAFGAELAYNPDGPPTVRTHTFRTPRDAASLSLPSVGASPGLAYLRESARLFMQEMHRRIVYLDTGVMPVPTETLAEMGSYFGLQVEVLAVAPDLLAAAVARALDECHD